MTYATLDELRSQLGKPPKTAESAAYAAKMMHHIPEADVVDRVVFILKQVAGKRVLEFGASGPMHDGIVKASKCCIGVDRIESKGVIAFDLDAIETSDDGNLELEMPIFQWVDDDGLELGCGLPYQPDVIICGEVLEHLANPGWFLQRLKRQYAGVPVVITVPNAFSSAARKHAERGTEQVNKDHVCWYSWKTMTVLLERYGYTVKEFHFYNGESYTAEGLIFVCE